MLELLLSSLSLTNLAVIAIGVVWGLVFGAIPGLTATLAVVVLIPITYGMGAVTGMSMLIGIYIGGVSGGMVASILVGMPGTPASIVTVFDGFPLAKQGLGRKALGVGIVSNTIGGLFGWLCLITIAPQIARLALKLGAFEYSAIIIFGLTAVVSLSGKSLRKGFIMAAFGLLVATIGFDPTYGMPRNTFGITFLRGGINPIPALIGLFVISQVFLESERTFEQFLIPRPKKTRFYLTLSEFKASIFNYLRSGMIGVFSGILPGIGGTLGAVVAYDQAKKSSSHPESFGEGNIQGLVASETANNASLGGALIPMLSLGIPGDAATAALLGGLMLHGLTPGPLLIRENPEIVYGVFSAYLIATIAMFLVMTLGTRLFPVVLRIKKSVLLPLVLVAGIVGCFNLQYSFSDVWVALLFGLFGFVLVKHEFSLMPIVISVVLGNMLEMNLRLALLTSRSGFLPFLTRPVALLFLIASVFSVVFTLSKRGRGKA